MPTGFYASYPVTGGGGVAIYPTLSAFPVSATTGSLAVAADTGILYEFNGASWVAIGGPGAVLSLGAFGSTPNAQGLSLAANVLSMQPADGTHPGGVSILAQTFAGDKTFSGNIIGQGVISAATQLQAPSIGMLSGAPVIDLSNFFLKDNNGYVSVAWNLSQLKDLSNINSANWNTRLLQNTSGSTILNWSGSQVTLPALGLTGSGSGTISILPQAAAGTYNFNLPTTAGTSGQVLTSAGGVAAPMTWTTPTTGTVTSVGLSVPATSIFGTSGSPVTGSGTLGLTTTGTSGGIPYFSSTSALSSSALLAASQVVIGGGAGIAPSTLAAGTSGQVLAISAGIPTWTTLSSAGFAYLSSSTSVYGGTNTTLSFTGADNTVVGVSAGNALTSGTDNTLYGYHTGLLETTGSFNTILGSKAGVTQNGVSNNTFIGYEAGMNATSGDNVCLGYEAGLDVTSSGLNVVIGSKALAGTGGSNIVIGYQAVDRTSSSNNIMIGVNSGNFPTASQFAVMMGYGVAAATKSVVIGGIGASSTGNYSILLGCNTADNSNANTIIIGNQKVAASNTGCILFGTTADASQLTPATNGNGQIGFGTSGTQAVQSQDMFLGRGIIGDATAPNCSLQPSPVVGANIAGGNLTIAAGNGTGTGGSGSIIFKTAPVAGSSSTANSLTSALTLDKTAGATFSSLAGSGTRFVTASSTGLLAAATGAATLTALGIFAGKTAISSGVTTQAVTFSSSFGSTNYAVTANLLNTVDASPQFQPITITAQSTSGFTATWNAPTDSANFLLSWQAIINN